MIRQDKALSAIRSNQEGDSPIFATKAATKGDSPIFATQKLGQSPYVALPLLITGLAGVPGFNAWHYFHARYPGQVIGMRQQDDPRIQGQGVVACNAEDRERLARLFDRYQFRSVLDCAGNCA